jgi:hypothetical protein
MARTRTPKSIPKFIAVPGQPKIYAEGKHDYDYLTVSVENGVILQYVPGTRLRSTEVKLRIEAIKQDLVNDAIECLIWIVDGGDDHIKAPTFIKFYKEWLGKKDGDWKKLHILINSPCLEYWFLLHRVDSPIDDKKGEPICFEDADALFDSTEFKKHCHEGKGANLVRTIANSHIERKRAIKRAKKLSDLLINLKDSKLLSVARAEMYQVFELIMVEQANYSSLKNTP